MDFFNSATRHDDDFGSEPDDGKMVRSPCERTLLEELAHLHEESAGAVPAATVRYALLFTGDVQFVGFRWVNRQLAEKHQLTGWVQNLDDGSVRMELQGAPAAVAAHFGRVHACYAQYGNRIWLEMAERIDPVPDEERFEVVGI